MGRSARITSVDAVQDLAAAVVSFRGQAAAALDDLDMELRRAVEWIHHDRKEYWAQEVRRGYERVSEARVQLQQAQTSRRVADHEASCLDEKKALDRAKRRLDVAQEKVGIVRQWMHVIDHAVNEYRGTRTLLAGWLDSEVPRALSALNRITETLDAYLAATAPADTPPPVSLAVAEQPAVPDVPVTQDGSAGEQAGDCPNFREAKMGLSPSEAPDSPPPGQEATS